MAGGGFANQRTVPVAEFGPDPRERHAGWLHWNTWVRLQGFFTAVYGPERSDPSTTFNGTLVTPPQHFAGLQPRPGSGVPYTGQADISTGLVEGPLGDPSRRIFAQRLARRSAAGGA